MDLIKFGKNSPAKLTIRNLTMTVDVDVDVDDESKLKLELTFQTTAKLR